MVKNGTCGLCQGGCAVVYTIENGKIVKAEPDKESPKGRLCPRGIAPRLTKRHETAWS